MYSSLRRRSLATGVVFQLKREPFYFLFDGGKVRAVLKIVSLFCWQGLPQSRIAGQGHSTEVITDNSTLLVTK